MFRFITFLTWCRSAYTSGSSKSMEKKFKERGETITRQSNEISEKNKKIKSLEAELKAARARSGTSGTKPRESRKPAAGMGPRSLKEKVDIW